MAAITSTTESWNGHKFSEVESHIKGNYLQLGGGTLTGRLNVNGNGSTRGEIYLISSGDVPNDLYFGAGGSSDWSISSRGTSDGKYIGLYNNNAKGWVWKVGYTTGVLDFLYRPTYNGTNLALATDLNSYSLTSHTHSNYSLTNHTHSDYSLTSHTHSYLPLTGGTLTGDLSLSASAGRSTLNIVTPSDVPCDLFLGSNSQKVWSITCRGTNESQTLDFYADPQYGGEDHVIVIEKSGKAKFKNTVHSDLHMSIGLNTTTYDSARAELDIISTQNTPAEFWLGSNGTRYWATCCRNSTENYIYAIYRVGLGYAVQIDASGNFTAAGGVTALSDIRHKTIVKDTDITVEQIANMPSVIYKWNDRKDDSLHVGSIAQEWQSILPEVVLTANDEEGTLSMQYGVAALVSSITTARKVVDHEKEIKALKAKINVLEERISELEG